MTPSLDVTILRWLARRTNAAAPAIGAACAMVPGEIRARFVALETLQHVIGGSSGLGVQTARASVRCLRGPAFPFRLRRLQAARSP